MECDHMPLLILSTYFVFKVLILQREIWFLSNRVKGYRFPCTHAAMHVKLKFYFLYLFDLHLGMSERA